MSNAAVRGIREADPTRSIGVIGAEFHPPYNRPPLSKGLWKGESPDTIWRHTDQTGAELHVGRRVTRLDLAGKRVTDDQGDHHTFGKLLLATGGSPPAAAARLRAGHLLPYLRRLQRLWTLAERPMRFAVIGGGFIGTEIGAALRMAGRDVTMLVPEPGLGARVFPADLSGFLVDYYREKGVQLRMGEGMRGLRPQGGGVAIQTTSGAEFQADVVVAGLGIQPNVQLTEQAGLKVENGIWWTRSCAPASRTFTQRGMSPTSTIPHSMGACGSSTKTMPTRWTCRPGMFHSPPHSGSPDWQPPMQETNQSRSRSAAAWLGIEGTTAFGARPVLTLHPA